jgi:hypothetical protein
MKDSKSAEGNLMGVRFPLPAPRILKALQAKWPLQSERPFASMAVLVAVGLILLAVVAKVAKVAYPSCLHWYL